MDKADILAALLFYMYCYEVDAIDPATNYPPASPTKLTGLTSVRYAFW